MCTCMGFGSYDESEQEKHEVETDLDDDTAVRTEEFEYDGAVEYEYDGASNDQLLSQLEEIKNRED